MEKENGWHWTTIAADRQQWRNLTAVSMAEISWTMITWPDCNLAMSFAVTQLNQLLFQSLCNQQWCFYRNWVHKIYEQWLNNRQTESNRLLESELVVNNTTWKHRVHRIPEIPRWHILSTKATIKRVQKLHKPGQTLTLTRDPTRSGQNRWPGDAWLEDRVPTLINQQPNKHVVMGWIALTRSWMLRPTRL